MLINIIMIFISAIVIYYIFDNYNFKVAGFMYLLYSIMEHCIEHGFSYFLIYLIIYVIKAVVVTLLYYKIYSISYSFWKFFALSLILEIGLIGLYMAVGIWYLKWDF